MKAALLVIDMQNDYLSEKRKRTFAYDTEHLTNSVNNLIRKHFNEGHDVIYIRHLIQNLPTNRALFGYSIEGTEGAELYRGLDVVSDCCFDKYIGDALSNKELRKLIQDKGYDKLLLCGLDECGCITATALGAQKRGIEAEIVREGTATVMSERKVTAAHKKLKKAGVRFV